MPTVKVSPTIGVAGHAADDCIGGKLTLAGVSRVAGTDVILQSIVVIDMDKEDDELVFYFFDENPATGAYADDAALDIDDADMDLCIGAVKVVAVDYLDAADNSVATKTNIGLPCKPKSGTTLYCLVKTTGGSTWTAATDLQFIFGFIRE